MNFRIQQYSLGAYLIEEWYTPERTRDGFDPEPYWKTVAFSGSLVNTLNRIGRGDLVHIVESCRSKVSKALNTSYKPYSEMQTGHRFCKQKGTKYTYQVEKFIKATEKMEARWVPVKWVNRKHIANTMIESAIPVADAITADEFVDMYKLSADCICENPNWYKVI